MKALVIVSSYHHMNTAAVARAMARALDAEVLAPQDVEPTALGAYDLVGFGSGIDSGRHYRPLLDLADRLREAQGKKAFLFSTCGAPAFIVTQGFIRHNHAALREKLRARGFAIVDEFGCPGWNTNVFLRHIGGLNKGRPDAEDLGHAEAFASAVAGESREHQTGPSHVTNR